MANVSSSNSLGERIPKLRFPGFEGDWDSEIFSNLFTFLSNNTLSRANLSETGNILNIHYGDILVKYAAVVNVDDEIIPFVSNDSEGKVKSDMLRTGDVIIADTAEDDTVGKAIEIINHNNKSIVSGLHTMPCRPNRDFTESFLGYYISSNAYHSQLYPYMQGIKVTSISKINIGKTIIHFPSSNEQKKIVNLFNLIEKKILIQKKLIESLKLYKRGLLSKLFPQKGESVPQYRFAGFMDAWEQRKLIDISEIVTGTTPPTKDKDNYDGGKLFVSPADIQGNRYVDETITTLTPKGFELGRKLRPGTSLFVSIGSTIGKVAQIRNYATTNQQINAVISNNNMDDDFTFTLLEQQSESIRKMSAQQAVPIINKTTFGNIKIFCPSKEEQKKVGEYFKHLDHLITLHQRKYNAYKKEKLALLQQMFI